MGSCNDGPSRIDMDLDDEVSRSDLADCIASGWSAYEIAEELGLDGAADVARWCEYHDLPVPHIGLLLPPPAAPVQEIKATAIRREPAPVVVSAPAPVQIQDERSAAGGGKSAAADAASQEDPTADVHVSQRALRQREMKQRVKGMSSAEVHAAVLKEGGILQASRALGISKHHTERLFNTPVGRVADPTKNSGSQLRVARLARRKDLTNVAVLSLKMAGASLNEVYGLVRVEQAAIKAIYNGETT